MAKAQRPRPRPLGRYVAVIGVVVADLDSHVATRFIRLHRTPQAAWQAIIDIDPYAAWRADLTKVDHGERLIGGLAVGKVHRARQQGRPSREHYGTMARDDDRA
jgi:hypothetical protein